MGSVKVLVVNFKFLPHAGGVETFTEMLSAGLVGRGADVTVVATNPAPPEFDEGFPFRVLRRPNRFAVLREIRRADVVLWNAPMVKWAWLHAVAWRPRVSVVHDWPGKALSGRSSARGREALMVHLAAISRATSDVLVCVSRDLAQQFRRDAKIIPNGYRDDVFRICTDPTDRDPGEVISLSRLVPEKGLDVLLHAVERVVRQGSEIRLTVVGDGAVRRDLEGLAAALGLAGRARFVGSVSHDELNTLLNQASVAVVPSCCREAFGIAVLEAEAAGCAVVASNIGGLPEALDGTGVLVPPGDVEALAAVLTLLVNDSESREAARRGVDERLSVVTADAMVDSYWAVIQALLSRKGRRHRLRRILQSVGASTNATADGSAA